LKLAIYLCFDYNAYRFIPNLRGFPGGGTMALRFTKGIPKELASLIARERRQLFLFAEIGIQTVRLDLYRR
jgi:hypothetical protein